MHLLWLFWRPWGRSMDLACWPSTTWMHTSECPSLIWAWASVLQFLAWQQWQLQRSTRSRKRAIEQVGVAVRFSGCGSTPSHPLWHCPLCCSLDGQEHYLVQLPLCWYWRSSEQCCSSFAGQVVLPQENRCVFCCLEIPFLRNWMECRTLPVTPSRLWCGMGTRFMSSAAMAAQLLTWLQRIMVPLWLEDLGWRFSRNTRLPCHLLTSWWHWCVSSLTSFSSSTSLHVQSSWCRFYGGWASQSLSPTTRVSTSMQPMCLASLVTTLHKSSEQLAKSCSLWWRDTFSLMALRRIKVGSRDMQIPASGPQDATWNSSILPKQTQRRVQSAAMVDLIFLLWSLLGDFHQRSRLTNSLIWWKSQTCQVSQSCAASPSLAMVTHGSRYIGRLGTDQMCTCLVQLLESSLPPQLHQLTFSFHQPWLALWILFSLSHKLLALQLLALELLQFLWWLLMESMAVCTIPLTCKMQRGQFRRLQQETWTKWKQKLAKMPKPISHGPNPPMKPFNFTRMFCSTSNGIDESARSCRSFSVWVP